MASCFVTPRVDGAVDGSGKGRWTHVTSETHVRWKCNNDKSWEISVVSRKYISGTRSAASSLEPKLRESITCFCASDLFRDSGYRVRAQDTGSLARYKGRDSNGTVKESSHRVTFDDPATSTTTPTRYKLPTTRTFTPSPSDSRSRVRYIEGKTWMLVVVNPSTGDDRAAASSLRTSTLLVPAVSI